MSKAMDIKQTPAIAQELDAVLKAADFTVLESRRIIGGQGQAVYDLMYINGNKERVYITAHEPPRSKNV
jgi:hypothetical protein